MNHEELTEDDKKAIDDVMDKLPNMENEAVLKAMFSTIVEVYLAWCSNRQREAGEQQFTFFPHKLAEPIIAGMAGFLSRTSCSDKEWQDTTRLMTAATAKCMAEGVEVFVPTLDREKFRKMAGLGPVPKNRTVH